MKARLGGCHALALSTIAAVCVSGCGGSPRAPDGTSVVALFNRAIYGYSASVPISQEAQRYSVMVLQATDSGLVASLHAANPRLKILVYQDLLISKPSDPTGLTTCTPYARDGVDHPGWFLTDQAGGRTIDRSYSGDYLMDVGNPAYQRACVEHAAALAAHGGFDGVFFDDLTARLSFDLGPGTTVPVPGRGDLAAGDVLDDRLCGSPDTSARQTRSRQHRWRDQHARPVAALEWTPGRRRGGVVGRRIGQHGSTDPGLAGEIGRTALV